MKRVRLLLIFLLVALSPITSRAATTQAAVSQTAGKEGEALNTLIKSFSNSSNKSTSDVSDTITEKIVFLNKGASVPSSKFQRKSAGNGIFAYYDKENKICYIFSTNTIKFGENIDNMFAHFTALKSVSFGNNIDSSATISCEGMFDGCYNLKSIDFGSFNTKNIRYFASFFRNCSSLESLNLSSFNTTSAVSMDNMFMGCKKLKSLNLSSFNTSKVMYMNNMFSSCESLEKLDLSRFVTSRAFMMMSMFNNCTSLKELNLRNFTAEKITNIDYMFTRCLSLESVDISGFVLKKNVNEQNIFLNCSKLSQVKAPKYNVTEIQLPGAFVLDNDNNYVSDNGNSYSKIPVNTAGKSNRYVRVITAVPVKKAPAKMSSGEDKEVKEVKEEKATASEPATKTQTTPTSNYKEVDPSGLIDINYEENEDGTLTVKKVPDKKNVSINTVTICGKKYAVTEIENRAATGNTKIRSLYIGSKVKRIGLEAFKNCKNLKKITIEPNKSLVIGKNAFKKLPKGSKITVKGVNNKKKRVFIKKMRKYTNAIVK